MKKLLTLLLTLVMALCLANLSVNHTKASDENATIYWGLDVSDWTLHLGNQSYEGTYGQCGDTDGVFTDASQVSWHTFAQNCKKVKIDSKINPTSIAHWFQDMKNVESIENLSNIDVSNCTSFIYTFYDCQKIESLDLSSWNTSNVGNANSMFHSCSKLKTIMVGSGWSIPDNMGNSMFTGCSALIGGNGTKYDSASTNEALAKIDKEGQAGYLTDKENGPIYCDGIIYAGGKWYNGDSSVAANELNEDQLALYGISYNQSTNTATLSKSLTSTNDRPTLFLSNVNNVILTKNIKITSTNQVCFQFGVSINTSKTIYGNGHTLETDYLGEEGFVSFGCNNNGDSNKTLTLDNITLISKSKAKEAASVSISKCIMKNNAKIYSYNTAQKSVTSGALFSVFGIEGTGYEILGSNDSDETINLSTAERNHAKAGSVQTNMYSVNIGSKDAENWQHAYYIKVAPIPTPSPSEPVVKDESCEKVIGPTWHWNNTKGICEDYGVVGTSTR